ncbi:hypothetical protein HDE_12972 [Halotydeus destructor]|nr:hypothetical protein HDE_12972 [Halotydeus destructor]
MPAKHTPSQRLYLTELPNGTRNMLHMTRMTSDDDVAMNADLLEDRNGNEPERGVNEPVEGSDIGTGLTTQVVITLDGEGRDEAAHAHFYAYHGVQQHGSQDDHCPLRPHQSFVDTTDHFFFHWDTTA